MTQEYMNNEMLSGGQAFKNRAKGKRKSEWMFLFISWVKLSSLTMTHCTRELDYYKCLWKNEHWARAENKGEMRPAWKLLKYIYCTLAELTYGQTSLCRRENSVKMQKQIWISFCTMVQNRNKHTKNTHLIIQFQIAREWVVQANKWMNERVV